MQILVYNCSHMKDIEGANNINSPKSDSDQAADKLKGLTIGFLRNVRREFVSVADFFKENNITDTVINSSEVQSAAREKVIELLRNKDVRGAAALMRDFKTTNIFDNSSEMKLIVGYQLVKYFSIDGDESFIDLVKLFNLNEYIIQTPDLVERFKKDIRHNIRLDQFSRVNKLRGISREFKDVIDEEIEDEIYGMLLTNSYELAQTAIDEYNITSEVVNKIVKKYFVRQLPNGRVTETIRILKNFDIPDYVINSQEVQEVLQIELNGILSSTYNDLREAFELIKLFNRSDMLISSPEIRITAEARMIECLDRGEIFDAIKLINVFGLIEELMNSQEIIKIVNEKIIELVGSGEISESSALVDKFSISNETLSSPEMQKAAGQGMYSRIGITYGEAYDDGDYSNIEYECRRDAEGASQIAKVFQLPDTVKNEVCSAAVSEYVSKMLHSESLASDIEYFSDIQEQFSISDSDFKKMVALGVVKNIFIEEIQKQDIDAIRNHYNLDDQTIVEQMELQNHNIPNKITFYLNFESSNQPLGRFVKKMREIVEYNPNITNVENSQWHSDLIPLFSTLDINHPDINIMDHQQEILAYLREIGPVDNIDLLLLSIRMQKSLLTQEDKERLSDLGVNNFNLGELRMAIDRVQDAILNNKMQELNLSLGNPIVYGMFKARFLLSSRWDKNVSPDEWANYSEDTYTIPEYLAEPRTLKFAVENVKQISSKELDEYINGKEFDEAILTKHQLFRSCAELTPEMMTASFLFDLTADIQKIEKVLKLSSDAEWVDYIGDSENEEESKKRAALQKKLSNLKARTGMELRIEKLKSIKQKVEQMPFDPIERLGVLLDIPEAGVLFDQLLALGILSAPDLQGFKESITEEKIDRVKYVANLHELLTHGLKDHYLDKFDNPALIERINKAMGLIEFKKGKNVIEHVKGKVDELMQTEIISKEKLQVELIPVSGLARLTAGNIGDACYTSRVSVLHNNSDYQRLHAFLYARKDTKNNLIFKGSCLLVETENEEGDTVFVIRANNPREGFLMSMSEKAQQALVDETIKAFKSYAQEYTNKTGKTARVAIIDDAATMSSTNRNGVWNAYRKYCSGHVFSVIDEIVTNFNVYKLSKKILFEV